jgi:four helix bundle protein
MKTFRTLELAIEFYDLVEHLKITGHLRDQVIRAAGSVPLNLSEGNAKPSSKEKRRFYQTAYASLKECQTIFKMAKIEDEKVLAMADHLGASIHKLVQSKITEIGNSIP